MENGDSSYYYYQNALNLRRVNGNWPKLAESHNNVGYSHYILGNLDSARWYYRRSLEIVERLNLTELNIKLSTNIFLLLLEDNLKDSALIFFEKAYHLQEELYDEQNALQINELRTKYETERVVRQSEINTTKLQLRTTQRNYLFAGLILVFVVLLSAYSTFRNRQRHLKRIGEQNRELHQQEINQLLQQQEINSLNALMEGQEKERHRIAEELHDRLGSKLAAVKLHYDAGQASRNLDKHKVASRLLDETIKETRQIAHDLASGVLDKFGLYSALKDLKCTLESSNRIQVELLENNMKDVRLRGRIELNLYRIVQELLSNILKHARANNITIQITYHKSSDITLMVEDDGIGFDPELQSEGMGLRNVLVRAQRLNGEVHIDSRPGYGTSITVDVPL